MSFVSRARFAVSRSLPDTPSRVPITLACLLICRRLSSSVSESHQAATSRVFTPRSECLGPGGRVRESRPRPIRVSDER